MTEAPSNLKYTEDHEWLRTEEDGAITIGITDHAQEALGELVFVEVPDTGGAYSDGDACAVVESVKAASDVYCPLAGTVVEVNTALADEPELINSSPYDAGWILRLRPDDASAIDGLMSAGSYQDLLAGLED